MRTTRMAALGASLLVLILGACTTGASSPSPSGPASTTPAATDGGAGSPSPSAIATGDDGGTIASTLVLGGPPECPDRPFCLIGLQETYGLEFAEFRPLDAGGPITVEALDSGEVDVALLFTSDPQIEDRGFVQLEDDQGLQRADNLVPVVSQEVLTANPEVAEVLNEVSAALSQEDLVTLNRRATVDQDDPATIAADFLEENDLLVEGAEPVAGEPIAVGKTNFYEQDILAELYAQALESNGYPVERTEAPGNREVAFPALESGDIDILPEYAATALEFVNNGAGEATADPDETARLLAERLADRGLTALEPAPASDQNT
nr:hypothetical protein [Chloroflexota bacterium]